MGIAFEYLPVEVEEVYDPTLSPVEVTEYLSRLKLSPVKRDNYPEKTLFLACDTIVVLHGQIIGKPKDEVEARHFLRLLSGEEHVVVSGLTVASPKHILTNHEETRVRFKILSEDEIDYYVSRYAPMDKAGAYGIQEWIGYVAIANVQGSFYNIMGLPTLLLWNMLSNIVCL
jgi:septum formation protein